MDFSDLLAEGKSAVRSKADVIPFPTLCLSGMLHAIVADKLKSVNTGTLRRIYFTMELMPTDTKDRILSRLKGIFVLPNVRFSALSVRHGKMLVSASCIKEISPSPSPSPSPSGLLNFLKYRLPSGPETPTPSGG
jgi:hypothetical protein